MRVMGRERECVYACTSCCSCALVAAQTSQGHYKTRTDSERNIQLTASGATARGESVLYRLVEFFRPQLRTFPHHPCPTRSDLLLRCKDPDTLFAVQFRVLNGVANQWRLRSGQSCCNTLSRCCCCIDKGCLAQGINTDISANAALPVLTAHPSFNSHSSPSVPCRTPSM